MTTIVYRDGRLAMDTQVNSGHESSTFAGRVLKGGKTADGYLWAMAGRLAAKPAFRAWVEGERKEDPPTDDQCDFVVVTPDGTVRHWINGWIELKAEYHAWGSGMEYALGAMAVGANADQAVEAACRHDVWSSEPIVVELLGEAPAEEAKPAVDLLDALESSAPDWREERGLK